MFSKQEIKKNLHGCLDVVLFMPMPKKRFGKTFEEAKRSFLIPLFLFPLTLMFVYLSPHSGYESEQANTFALLYSLRTASSWAIFFGLMYWLTGEIDRREHFYQFVTAINWLTIPATVIFIPIAYFILSHQASWDQLHMFSMCLMAYTYGFTAYMASRVLRLPWELGGFVAMISLMVHNGTTDIAQWVTSVLS